MDLFQLDGGFEPPVTRTQVDFLGPASTAKHLDGLAGQAWVLPVVEEQVDVTI